ncbi:MAG: glutamate-5-semialdehyde dehydrogenase [Deltaproteobacteria bacterium]|nr:MAG: glutamate-5-semialdehyde dehydrogenase [Deltaproteobacteria bacterium]
MNPIADLAAATRRASRHLAAAPGSRRDDALRALARILDDRRDDLLAANRRDLAAADRDGLAPALRGRLALTHAKLDTLIDGCRALVAQGDPIGRPLRRTELDEGLVLTQVHSPIGVILVIFESRPDAVIQIGSLALRTGNAVLLKGGSEAVHSNRALVACLRAALEAAGLPAGAVEGVESRADVGALLDCDRDIDLVIPRGSGALVRSIQQRSRIPVLGHADGVCHLYLDASADVDMAVHLAVDGKTDYPAACNATEALLVHRGFLAHLPTVAEALRGAGVCLRADERARAVIPWADAATADDRGREYGDLTLAVFVVDDIDAAISFIHTYGSGHTDAICTEDPDAADRFLGTVDSASVFHNASTRFADGYRYGLGAEVGISTGRIHARGPVGAEGLLTTRWLLRGSGQGVGDYGDGGRRYTHRALPLE